MLYLLVIIVMAARRGGDFDFDYNRLQQLVQSLSLAGLSVASAVISGDVQDEIMTSPSVFIDVDTA